MIYEERLADEAQAQANFEQALAFDPTIPAVKLPLARRYEAIGRTSEAARLYAEGKFDEAAAKYREALVDDPDSRLLHYNAGAADYRDGKFDDAVATLGRIAGSDARPRYVPRSDSGTCGCSCVYSLTWSS